MHKLFTWLFLAISFSAFADSGKSSAQYNAEILDSFCIQNQDNFGNIVFMAKSAGGKVLPDQQADPAMRELGGKTVFVPYEGKNYMVAFANGGGCTVITKNIDHVNLAKLLKHHFQVVLVDRQASLSQINELYKVKLKGIYKGAVISLVYAQSETGYTEGSISFLPASIVKRTLEQ
jgi:hypothetical protein